MDLIRLWGKIRYNPKPLLESNKNHKDHCPELYKKGEHRIKMLMLFSLLPFQIALLVCFVNKLHGIIGRIPKQIKKDMKEECRFISRRRLVLYADDLPTLGGPQISAANDA